MQANPFCNPVDTYIMQHNSIDVLKFIKVGNTVQVNRITLKSFTDGVSTLLGTLPEEFRPIENNGFCPIDNNNKSGLTIYLSINTNGTVQMENYGYGVAGTAINTATTVGTYLC